MNYNEKEVKALGMKIKIARIKQRLSQKAVAAKIGCTNGAISNWERGEKVPSYFAIKDLEKALGTRFEEETQPCKS